MIYCFDLDGTICSSVENSKYNEAVPFPGVVEEINKLKEKGDQIIINTARGCVSGIDHTELTIKQLNDWGIKYDRLIMHSKPNADIYIDDKAMSAQEWRNKIILKKGLIAGCFDIIHPGYIKMFKDAKYNACNYLIIALHVDPSIERPSKLKPIHTIDERKEILSSIKYIDEIVTYETENDLINILKIIKPNIRIVGTDYIGKHITGDLPYIEMYFHKRTHEYSYTNLRDKL
jgi:glycerol-3-phosphate cytidylyltransferase